MEIRTDILGRRVLIAEGRAVRPHDISSRRKKSGICYFCPGNEHLTPKELFHIGEPWMVRVFPNKFPILKGSHYVVVEHRKHASPFKTRQVFRNMIDGFRELHKRIKDKFAYIIYFKNHGASAGASIHHPHSQVIGLDTIPEEARKRLSPGFMSYVKKELSSERRINKWAFCPYASLQPYETWMVEGKSMEELDHETADKLFAVASSIYSLVGEFSFNLNLFYHPKRRWVHFQLLPRINIPAGFEIGSGIIVNTLSPEKAARNMRNA